MIVREFLQWQRTASASDRADATSALARGYLYSEWSADDRAAAEGALIMVLDDSSPLVRTALAQALAVSELSPHTAPLARLTARHGAYLVTGNHEYYSGEPAWTAEFRRLGLHVLMNEHVVLNHHGAALVVAGVTDYSAHHFDPAQRSDPSTALAGAPPGAGAKLLLAHQPRTAPAASAAGFDLQLSGHTHGGQFWPWNLFVRLQQPFTAGLHRLNHLWVYVSRGTGYWGPPKRLGVPSEITRLRLIPA